MVDLTSEEATIIIANVWNTVKYAFEKNDSRNAAILAAATYSVSQKTITITLNVAAQESVFKSDIKPELQKQLFSALQSNDISFVIACKEEVQNIPKPYTNSEKYNFLLQQNSELDKLRQRFNLDFKE